jgi:hypothetical protein
MFDDRLVLDVPFSYSVDRQIRRKDYTGPATNLLDGHPILRFPSR